MKLLGNLGMWGRGLKYYMRRGLSFRFSIFHRRGKDGTHREGKIKKIHYPHLITWGQGLKSAGVTTSKCRHSGNHSNYIER